MTTLSGLEQLLTKKTARFCVDLPELINNDFSIYEWTYRKLSLYNKPDEWFIRLIETRLECFKKSKTEEIIDGFGIWVNWGAVVDIAKIAIAWFVIRNMIKSDDKEWIEKELEEINKSELS